MSDQYGPGFDGFHDNSEEAHEEHRRREACDALWAHLLAEGRVRWMIGMRLRAKPDAEEEPLPELLIYEVGEPAGRRLYCVDVSAFPGKSWQVLGLASEGSWTDPATLGCLLAMAWEAWGDPLIYCTGEQSETKRMDFYVFGWETTMTIAHGTTEAEALLRAIEAAPNG